MPEPRITANLIALCGMDCPLCLAYNRKKNGCPGCKVVGGSRPLSCEQCRMKNCEKALAGGFSFCFECDSYPCKRVKHIDKRYRAKYHMSMIENLDRIKLSGIQEFLAGEEQKWTCPQCAEILCCHRPLCPHCGYAWQETDGIGS